jgi:hypothetical protein
MILTSLSHDKRQIDIPQDSRLYGCGVVGEVVINNLTRQCDGISYTTSHGWGDDNAGK